MNLMYMNNRAVFLTRRKSLKTLLHINASRFMPHVIHFCHPQVAPASFRLKVSVSAEKLHNFQMNRTFFLLVYVAFKWRRILSLHILWETFTSDTIHHAMYENYETIVLSRFQFRRRLDIVEEFFLRFFLRFLSFLVKINLIKSTKLTFFVVASSFNDIALCNTKEFLHFYACTSMNEKLNRISISAGKISLQV